MDLTHSGAGQLKRILHAAARLVARYHCVGTPTAGVVMAQLTCNRTQWRFHHEIWNLAGNRTSIAGISPDLVPLLQQDWIEQITRAIPAQLLILDPFGCVIVTLSHGLSMAPASIPRPVRPSLMKPCLGNLKNLLRISIIR